MMELEDKITKVFSEEEKIEELKSKLTKLLNGVSDLADQELMGWTVEELTVMQEYFGDTLLYDFSRNIETTLMGAHGNYTVH